MDITIHGNVTINGNISQGLLDNETSFKELVSILRKEAESQNGTEAMEKAKRRPGSEQLRKNHTVIARIPVGEGFCEVYDCGYALFDNGDRKTVLWVPEAIRAAQYYSPLTYAEKLREEHRDAYDLEEDLDSWAIIEGTESGEDRLAAEQLGDMPWYLAVVIAGENSIERNLAHPRTAGTVSDAVHVEDYDGNKSYCWCCGSHFPNPEDEYIRKETEAERRAAMTEKQREVFDLYYEDNLTQAEIAELLGISQKAVDYRLNGVEKKLKNFF